MQHLQKTGGVPRCPLLESVLSASQRPKIPEWRKGRLPHLSGTPYQPLDSRETCQWRGHHTFLLDKDLESLTHTFVMDQRLQLQPRFRALRLTLSFIVEVGKFISLPQRDEKCRL